ncbi:hypothetical protein [Rhizorhapis sp.]|uniref:hypothetical protein n=1 Tax=Rhizorhapis sp. TaxID=1968842 RepID=UPI002B47C7A0|nr:hypothetical protein [Rhizorhapis sp.]HKR16597.1 hypothetical protein [Rhizorhapis sp.]
MSINRLLSIVAALALMIAPVAMFGGGTAFAAPMAEAEMSVGHCAGMDSSREKQKPAASHDCVAACSAIAPAAATSAAEPTDGLILYDTLPFAAFHGIKSKAETPPPRFS